MIPEIDDTLGHRPFQSDAEAIGLCLAFAECTLPNSAWSHRAHLTAALWHLRQSPPLEALTAMRDGIKRYNRSVGTIDTPTNGYHETITIFYVRVIASYERELDPTRGFAVAANVLFDRFGDRNLPYRHYTKERLMSVEARARWVEPDLEPLPPWSESTAEG